MNILHDAALAYAKVGWPVFPLTPGGKTPLYANPHPRGSAERGSCRGWAVCHRFGHGVLDATTSVEMVDWWWSRTPSANIGLATGVTPVGASVDVVDIDVKDGAPGLVSAEKLRKAGLLSGSVGVVETPSGGLHVCFEPTRQQNGTMRGHGVDFRGLGGYVVAVPSVVGHQRYRWLEPLTLATGSVVDWRALRRCLQPPPAPSTEPAHQLLPTPAVRLVDWLAGQGEGNRNAALWWAVCKALEGGHDRTVVRELEAVATGLGLGDGEVTKTVASATRHVVMGRSR